MIPWQMRATPPRDHFDDGQPNYLLRGKGSLAGELGPFAFGQFYNIIHIGVLSLNYSAH